MELDARLNEESETVAEDEDYADDYANENGKCGICTDIVIDRGVLDGCDHWFCFACIDNWATITNLCPLCKHEFQLITCLPVYDTIGNIRAEEHSFSRDDDWCIQEKNNTLSFPSYYIDEDAVLCLDGDGCKIRNGLSIAEEDFTYDTSIACDSCDNWYHAFCVGFNPEGSASESSWLCPRCITDDTQQKSDRSHLENLDNQSVLTADAGYSSFSKKVSVSVADDGETAVVVSMVEAPEEPEPCNVSPSIVKLFNSDKETESSIPYIDSGNAKVDVQVDNSVCSELIDKSPNSLEIERNSEIFLDIPDDHKENLVELPLSKDDASELTVTQSDDGLQTSLVASVDGVLFSSDGDFKVNIADGTIGRPWSSDGVKIPSASIPCDTSETMKENFETDIKIPLDLSVSSPSEDKTFVSSGEDMVDVRPKDIELGVLMEDPTEERQPHVIDAGCLNNLTRKREMDTTRLAKKAKADENPQILPSRSQDRDSVSENSKSCTRTTEDSGDDNLRSSLKKARSSDIMSIVQERPPGTMAMDKSSTRRENANGLRVKKIMRRAGPNEESSDLVQKLKEIREAVQDKTSTTNANENDFDMKLLTAFRAAIVKPKDEVANKFGPSKILKKSLLQKGKTREKLTKKIYGASNGRRKRAWDRDWEIEFWKHRCKRTKSEKVETLHSVLELLKKATYSNDFAIDQGREKETNAILSRVYLADTSVFPRKDDIEPLSNLIGNSETAKESKMTHYLPGIYGGSTQVKAVSSDNTGKKSIESAPVSVSSSSKGTVKDSKEIASQSGDVKSDKRKWAMEVLARKNASTNSSRSQGQEEDKAALKGNYPLLAELPLDMRPVPSLSRHNKVSLSVRQAQLYRITEHYLRRTNLPVMRRTGDTELAIADAVNVEKEIYERSNSKLVYLNLCSQAVSQNSNKQLTSERISSNSTTATVDSTDKVGEELSNVEEALKLAGLSSDSPPNSPCGPPTENHDVDGDPSVLDVDSHRQLEIHGDSAHDSEAGGYLEGSKLQQKENGDSKLKVGLDAVSCYESVNLQGSKYQCSQTEIVSVDPNNNVKLGGVPGEISRDSSLHECGPEEQPSANETRDKVIEEMAVANKDAVPFGIEKHQFANKTPHNVTEEMVMANKDAFTFESEKDQSKDEAITYEFQNKVGVESSFAGNREPLNHLSSHRKISPNHSLMKETVEMERKTKPISDKDQELRNSVSKKVEAYVKEHIRPLCKSGVITVGQYRWAVGKTIDKVMKYHHKDKNAKFLIKEGEKVKKLAEQYVEAAHKIDL